MNRRHPAPRISTVSSVPKPDYFGIFVRSFISVCLMMVLISMIAALFGGGSC